MSTPCKGRYGRCPVALVPRRAGVLSHWSPVPAYTVAITHPFSYLISPEYFLRDTLMRRHVASSCPIAFALQCTAVIAVFVFSGCASTDQFFVPPQSVLPPSWEFAQQLPASVGSRGMVASDAPRSHHQHLPDRIVVEESGFTPDAVESLHRLGHATHPVHALSMAPSILRKNGMWRGRSDPRLHGSAAGY